MTRTALAWIVCVIACSLALRPSLSLADEPPIHLPAGRFGTVTVYKPSVMAQSVAIFLSGDGGWNLGVVNMAEALADKGAVVIGVDVTHYLHSLRDKNSC